MTDRSVARMAELLPSPERAREAGVEVRVDAGLFHRERSLLEEEPEAQRRVLALVARAIVVGRESWIDRTEVSPGRVAALPTSPPPVRADLEEQTFVVLRALLTDEPARCSHCGATPGWSLCSVCGGQGVVYEVRGSDRYRREVAVPCYGCTGAGSLPCSPCDGTGLTHRVELERGEDSVHGLEHVFLPPLAGELAARLSDHLLGWDPLPEPLRFDPFDEAPPRGGTPYRSAAPGEPGRWGFALGGVADDCRRTLARLGRGERVHRALEAHTVPLLVLEYARGATAVLAPGPDGTVAGFGHVG